MTEPETFLAKLLLVFAGVGVVIGLLYYASGEHDKRVKAEAALTVAQGETKIVEHTLTKEHVIFKEAASAKQAIEALPSGDTPLPEDVCAQWSSAIDGLRDTKPEDRNPCLPEGAVRPPE